MSRINYDIYLTLWAKYLPVIRILLKKSLTEEQTLALNIPDFQRAGMTRKSGYKFDIVLKNGKSQNVIIDLPVASALVTALLEDKVIKQLCEENEFYISLNPAFKLSIKHIPQPPLEEVLPKQIIPTEV